MALGTRAFIANYPRFRRRHAEEQAADPQPVEEVIHCEQCGGVGHITLLTSSRVCLACGGKGKTRRKGRRDEGTKGRRGWLGPCVGGRGCTSAADADGLWASAATAAIAAAW